MTARLFPRLSERLFALRAALRSQTPVTVSIEAVTLADLPVAIPVRVGGPSGVLPRRSEARVVPVAARHEAA